jgi:hypothetical protein
MSRGTALTLLAVLFSAQLTFAVPVSIATGTANDTESRIIRLADGRLMAAIGRNPYGRWDTTDVYVSFSTNEGAGWSLPALAIGAAGDQATIGLLQLPGDTIRLWYGSNESGTYRIHTAYSMNGTTWTTEGQVALGWTPTVMCYDPTVILEPDSSLTMIYRGGSGIAAGAYAAHRPRGGSWDTSRRLVNAAANRPRIMKHAGGTYLAAFQRKSGVSTTNIDIFVRRSTDLTAWSDSVRLTTNMNSHDAWCLQVPDSGYAVYYAKYQSAPYDAYNLCRRRSADGTSWQAEQQLTFDGSLLHNTQPCLFVYGNGLYRSWTRANDYDNDNDILFERFILNPSGVEMESFAARWDGEAVVLNWSCASEDGCYRWTVERSDDINDYTEIAALPGSGTSATGTWYTYDDRSIEPGGTYSYRLGRISTSGSITRYGPVEVSTGGTRPAYCRMHPNPVGANGTVFSFGLDRPARVRLEVYNLLGQRVALLRDGTAARGPQEVIWDGRNGAGQALANGVYVWRFCADGATTTDRLVLCR